MVFDIKSINPLEYDNFISDHISISSCIVYSNNLGDNNYKYFIPRSINKADFNLINLDLSYIDWHLFLNPDLDCLYLLNIFISTLSKIISKYTPVTKRSQFVYPSHIKIIINKCKNIIVYPNPIHLII